METRLLIIRHGQSEANVKKMWSGSHNVPLTPLGISQAEFAAEALRDEKIDAVFSSTLDRAYQTALPFAKMRGLEITRLPEFVEWNAGEWEGNKFEDLSTLFPEEYNTWMTSPIDLVLEKGESPRQVRERAGKAVEALIKSNLGKTILLVAHGGLVMTLPSYFAGCDDSLFNETKVSTNCSITEIVFDGESFRLVRYSDDAYLKEYRGEAVVI